ncbi:alpha/beta hydrolase [Costertonia aggregata]|uniref:Alpha/beta hydrolase n=1 Tax=Costertonia aggregata TaxID=343403 RepID=A0A7H9ASB7_9FLAO|nr:alpha/beta hydrolase [Costertonia aggregata]QLG46242.1 alpha/beta hydrolase [Costertonia aggregata]
MKKIILFVLLGSFISPLLNAQELVLKKGVVIDAVKVGDSIAESFSLYLPTNFETGKKWPLIAVSDMKGRGQQALRMMVSSAEEQGYVVVASNNINDSLSITKNILIVSRMLRSLSSTLPIEPNGIYMAGFSDGGRFASLVPNFVKGIAGVISCGANIANLEILSKKNLFHYIGIVGRKDFNYPDMIRTQTLLNKMGFPNRLIIFEGGEEWPKPEYISDALRTFTLASMGKGTMAKDDAFLKDSYAYHLNRVNSLLTTSQPLGANHLLGEMMKMYRPHFSVDSLKDSKKVLKRGKNFKARSRSRNAAFFKESLVREDYQYYLEEDVLTYNYNNLGWWNYQMEELKKYNENNDVFKKRMGIRLKGYVNALVQDYIDAYQAEKTKDEEALNFLWMVKTITAPKEYKNYLNIISNSARIEDYGTSLFYLEELLKNGYTDRKTLYALEHTALLRITPEFNEIVEKYLKSARYDIIEE